MTQQHTTTPATVTSAEVHRIDRADGLVAVACGVRLEAGQVRDLQQPGDRTPRGRLRKQAAARIAGELSAIAQLILSNRQERGDDA